MIGAIAGDIIGSVYESSNIKPEFDFPLLVEESTFTDDTVLTAAIADSLVRDSDFMFTMREYFRLYPDRLYGGSFHRWARGIFNKPYNSWGNGSAMRVSPIAWAYNDIDSVTGKAEESAAITHNHPEGIKGAQATALAIFLSRTGATKKEIKNQIEKRYDYNLDFDLEDLRKNYTFNVSCQGTVPQAIYTFLVSEDFEDSIRKAIYIGGDSDTLACINGSIAEAFYKGVPEEIREMVFNKLDYHLTKIIKEFSDKFINS